jgi:drug/metabolite transporter (DMT)-like permease
MNPEVAAVIVGPKKRSFVRRHKLVLALAAIGALFAVLPKHRVAIAGILLCSALAVGCVIAVVLVANFSTQPDRLPTVRPSEPSSSVWCIAAPKSFC